MKKIFLKMNNLKYNIFSALLLTLVYVVGEQIYRLNHPLLTFNASFDTTAKQFLIAFTIVLLANKKTIKVIYSFIMLMTFFQLVHFNYYGTWIFPIEYILFFTKFRETMETFTTVLEITILPIVLVGVMSYLIFKIIDFMSEKRVKIPYLSYVIILFMIFIVARVLIDDRSKKGARPNIEKPPIINTIETMGFLMGRIVPQKLFGGKGITQKVVDAPEIKLKNPDINIVVIMGESLTHKPMSLYGEEEQTTPFLDSLKSDKNFTYQIAFASGVMTDISMPSFFNMLYRPDSIEQIVSANTCLFKMAKENGFKTHFYSAQSNDALSNVKSYLCPKWIDSYFDGSKSTKDTHKDALDITLVGALDEVDFSKSNFVVLHQVGSHSPVRWRYPKEFEKFQKNENETFDLSGYKNTVYYTDYIISEIVKKVKNSSTKPTYLFFTSDHGTGIDNHLGHGRLNIADQYEVPFILYEINIEENLAYDLRDKKYTSHYEVSKLIAKTLGYDVSSAREYDGNHVVCGNDLSGIAGYLEVKIDNDEIKILKIID